MKGTVLWVASLLTIVLAGCMFLAGPGPWDPHGATVEVHGGQVVVHAGDWEVLGGILYVRGQDLRVNEPSCSVVKLHLECTLPKFPAKKNFVLPVAGHNIVADALVEREGGQFWARKVGQDE